jgi:N-acetylneuraminic acid mutarotase
MARSMFSCSSVLSFFWSRTKNKWRLSARFCSRALFVLAMILACLASGGGPAAESASSKRSSAVRVDPSGVNGSQVAPISTGRSQLLGPAAPSTITTTWTVGTPYPTTISRYGFAQTATHLYVFGGVSNGTRQNAVNRMDLTTGVWQSRAVMPFTSEAPTCALMAATGIVYCTEGDTGSGFASYNIATDTWSPLANIPGGDHYGSASGAFNGKVFVVGGTTGITDVVQVYDVASNTWSAGTAAPGAFVLAGYRQVGQYLYVVGGFSAAGPINNKPRAEESSVLNKGQPTKKPQVPFANNATTWRLDMSSAPGAWSIGPAFTPGRADFGLAYDAGSNKLYALGGDATGGGFFDSTNLVDELSVGSWPAGSWAASPDNLILPNRSANQAGFYGRGRIWSVGGLVGQGFTFLAEVQHRSNVCTPTWRNEPPLANLRRNAATVVVGSNLYAITGFNSAPNYTTVNERFDGISWTTLAPIPVPHAQSRGTSVGNNIYVPGGFNSVSFGGALDTMQIYNTTTNIWSAGMTLPAARAGVATATFNNLVYVIAGYNPVGIGHNEVYIYNPVTNSYTTGAPMPATQGNAAGVLLNGEIYVVGGGTAPGAQYAYNPTTNAWRTIAVLPTTGGTCQSDNGFVLNNELWIVGCLGLPVDQQVWVYTPSSNSWRAGPPYSVDHQGPGAALFNGRGFTVGGGAASGGATAVESVGGCGCQYRVLIVYADNSGPPSTLQSQILAEPGVVAVDLFDGNSGTPTLAQLQAYNIVVPFSNTQFLDGVALGNNLADYVDAGGIVVQYGFSHYGPGQPFGVNGRWLTGNYNPYTYSTNLVVGVAFTLGAFNAAHPLMAGVTTLNSNFQNVVAPAGGATQVAAASNGNSLIAFRPVSGGHTTIGVTAYVGTTAVQNGDWGRVIVNAGHWLGGSCAPAPLSAVSRKMHGGAGTFDVNLPLVAIGGAVGIECRTGAVPGAHQMVVTFASPVTVGGVSVTSGTGSASFSVAGAVVTINLTGVTNAQRLGVTLASVNDGTSIGDVMVPMGVLAGDTTGNGSVNASDVTQTKLQSGQAVTGSNFRNDVTSNGSINASDISSVKQRSGTALP